MGQATGKKGEEIIIHRSGIKVPYTWSAGAYATRFFTELKDNKKIWGTKCPKCNCTYIPPRKNCPKCFVNITEWVELGNTGTLLTYTIVRYKEPLIQPMEPPYAYGIIKLDGANTGLTHLLGEVDLNKIKPGMRVQAVFREKREGNILDIKYFKPLE